MRIIAVNLVRLYSFRTTCELLRQGFSDKDVRISHTEKLTAATKKKYIGAKCTDSVADGDGGGFLIYTFYFCFQVPSRKLTVVGNCIIVRYPNVFTENMCLLHEHF